MTNPQATIRKKRLLWYHFGMKTKLFVDFDGTMFDTTGFKEATLEVFRKAGFSKDELMTAYQAECLDYKYSITGMTERLKKVRYFNFSLTQARIEKLFRDVPRYIYDDTEQFLQSVDKSKYELILITLGETHFQHKKVENSKLEKYFDQVLYTEIQKWDYLENIVQKVERFILIDDRSDTIHQVSLKFPKALALQMNRRDEDRDDPARNGRVYKNLSVRNFRQAASYL